MIWNLRRQNYDFWGTKRVSKFPQCLFPGQPRSWKLQATSLWALNLESSHPIHWNKTNGFLYIGVFHFSSLLISKVPVMDHKQMWAMLFSSRALQQSLPQSLWAMKHNMYWDEAYKKRGWPVTNNLLTSFPKKFFMLLCIPVGVVDPPVSAEALPPPAFRNK